MYQLDTNIQTRDETEARMPRVDFAKAPYLILWELTRACALACRHCRARAIPRRNPNELSTQECIGLLDQFREFGNPLIVLTGGDPVQRPDLIEIIREAKLRGFKVALTPSATPSMTVDNVQQLREAGVDRLAISIDGLDATTHDDFRRVKGSFDISMSIVKWAHQFNIPIQINTTVWKGNFHQFDAMVSLVERCGAVLWSLFFLVPTGRASKDMQISPAQAEEMLQKMARLSVNARFDVKATAAPHFRRVLLQFISGEAGDSGVSDLHPTMRLGALRSYQSINDGKGVMFISHTGDIYPSGFLPLSAGNVRDNSVASVYRENAMFEQLRNPDLLKGQCGRCRFKVVCGGSRARAYAEQGDYLEEDSLCEFTG